MKRLTYWLLLGILACASCAGLFAQDSDPQQTEKTPMRHAAALKVIGKNLDALGGAEAFERIQSLTIKGAEGILVIEPTDHAAYHLEKPDRFKRVSATDVILCTSEKNVIDMGAGETPLDPRIEQNLDLMIPFMLSGFSLTTWKDRFDGAEYLGKKSFGEHEEYVVLLPEAQNGEDLAVHIDKETFLIDRLVFRVPHPQAKFLKNVWRLRDYRKFGEILMPTHLILETIGWKDNGQQLRIHDVKINPAHDDGLFAEARLDLGQAVLKDGALTGEVRATRYGMLHSNITDEDMALLAVGSGDWIAVTVGESTVKARYIKGFTPGQQSPRQESNVFCIHPRAGFPRLILLPQAGTEIGEDFTFEAGDPCVVTAAEPEAAGGNASGDQDE